MQYVGRLVSSVYNTITPNINPATLSGAIDVIVVERPIEVEIEEQDEWGGRVKKKTMTTELASTPFHVRFGKMSVLRPAERKVTLHLNNSAEPLPFAMKVGEEGEAFFVLELGDEEVGENIPADLVTSPIISPSASPRVQSQAGDQDGDSNEGKAFVDTARQHRTPRKFIEEDYVEPLDLGASRAASNQFLHSDLESNDASTIRSGETRASVETGSTSPNVHGSTTIESAISGHERGKDVSLPDEQISEKDDKQEDGVLGSLETAASKAGGAIGAVGRSIVPSLGVSYKKNAKLEKVVNREGRHAADTDDQGARGKDAEEEKRTAHHYEPSKSAEGEERMHQLNQTHPPQDMKHAVTRTDKLEVQMRDRSEELLKTTMQAREERRSQLEASQPRAGTIPADFLEESYPAPFGGTENATTSSAIETAPTTQSDHSKFLSGKRLGPIESGVQGKSALDPAQVDSRIVRGRLRQWEEEKEALNKSDKEVSPSDVDAKGKDEEIASKVNSRKEDLQYMLDMDGYKMTTDGEDLAFAEGHRFANELPLSKRHGGTGRDGHCEVLNHPHHHTASQLTGSRVTGEKLSYRRGSFGDVDAKPVSERASLKRRGSHSAPTLSDVDGPTLETGRLTPLLGFGSAAVGSARNNEKQRDALNLSRDLVRLTRSLRTGTGTADSDDDPDDDARFRRQPIRRQHEHDTSLSDTEVETKDSDTHHTHPRYLRATSEEPLSSSQFGDESPPIVRDDAALGRTPEYEWGWGKLPKRDANMTSHIARRQRVLSSPDLADETETGPHGSSLGHLTCDESDPYKFILELQDASHTFELSLCYVDGLGGESSDQDGAGKTSMNMDDSAETEALWAYRFEENKVSYQRFLDDEEVVNDERIVIRYNDRLLTWENASAVLATLSLYRRTLSIAMHDEQRTGKENAAVSAAQQGPRGSVWRRWWNRSKGSNGDEAPHRLINRSQTDSILEAKGFEKKEAAQIPLSELQKAKRKRPKTYAKTLRLTSDQLKSLQLRKGANTITFSVTSSYSGVATCTARIFLWESSHQIVVSDIDGTITKSDALGHVFTMIGRDWTHVGVAKLYTDVARNGYRIMYLTSRAIGQADTTRDYLRGIEQNNYKLPDGPVIMSPDRLMASLHREVILRKPEVFKMACLRDIARLFGADPRNALPQPGNEWPGVNKDSLLAANGPSAGKLHSPSDGAATTKAGNSNQQPTPFYAGFGNRITDALSYRSVNIPSSRIFTIDSNGEVKMELLELAGYKSSYIHMTDLVDQMFPPITLKSSQGNEGKPEFNDFNFWRPEIEQIELPPDEDLMQPLGSGSSPVSPALSARSVRSVRSNASIKSANREDSTGIPSEEGGSRLSRFGLGKLGLSRKGSTQTIASVPGGTADDTSTSRKVAAPTHAATMPPTNKSADDVSTIANGSGGGVGDFTQTPSSPSSYGSGVTSWAASWRRRAASPGANAGSGVQATSPLVGPVITAEPDEEESGDENDDVSSFGGDDNDDAEQGGSDTGSNVGDEGLEDDYDPLLATGDIQFDWRG